MDGGRTRLRHDVCLFINGGRNIHDLYIPRRKRMGLRKRRPGLLYYRVRLSCLHFVILASASRVDLRQTTQTDVAIRFFISKYNSPLLGILVSLVGIASLIPYLVLQLKGLGLIVSATSYGQIPPSAAVWIGAVSITIYVMISGIHGSAWISVVKDIMILGIVLYLGIYLPIHYYGGFTEMFKQIDAANPVFSRCRKPDRAFPGSAQRFC